jgi:anti-anti-sigma factor
MSTSTSIVGDDLDGARATTQTRRPPAQLSTRWLQPNVSVITADGEIDASNACDLIAYTLRHTDRAQQLVLNLTAVRFFGTEGFTALHVINVGCARAQTRWALVPSRAVTRLVAICDPDCALPTADSVDAAVAAALQDQPHRLLLLVSAAQ